MMYRHFYLLGDGYSYTYLKFLYNNVFLSFSVFSLVTH